MQHHTVGEDRSTARLTSEEFLRLLNLACACYGPVDWRERISSLQLTEHPLCRRLDHLIPQPFFEAVRLFAFGYRGIQVTSHANASCGAVVPSPYVGARDSNVD